jgi:hypothetical protein
MKDRHEPRNAINKMPTEYVDSSYKEHKIQNSQAESACDFDCTKCGGMVLCSGANAIGRQGEES